MTRRILLVEDNEQNRYLATYFLEKKGFSVTHAADGISALKLAAENRFDLVLLDIQLPGMDGHEIARRLRADPNNADIPIVAATSYAMVGDRERSFEAGCTGYLEKPINPETFIAEIESYLPHDEKETQ